MEQLTVCQYPTPKRCTEMEFTNEWKDFCDKVVTRFMHFHSQTVSLEEDIRQEAYIACWKVLISFKPSTKYPEPHGKVVISIRYRIIDYLRVQLGRREAKREVLKQIFYGRRIHEISEDEEILWLVDPDTSEEIFDTTRMLAIIEAIDDNSDERPLLQDIVQGYKFSELSKKYKISESRISQIIFVRKQQLISSLLREGLISREQAEHLASLKRHTQ